jgi:hypothetical protein
MCTAIACSSSQHTSFLYVIIRAHQTSHSVAEEITAIDCVSRIDAVLFYAVDSASPANLTDSPYYQSMQKINNTFSSTLTNSTTSIAITDCPLASLAFAVIVSCSSGPTIFMRHAVSQNFSCVSFFNNTAGVLTTYTGVIMMRNGDYVLRDCVFIQNNAIFLVSSSQPTTLTVTFDHCVFDKVTPVEVEPGVTMKMIATKSFDGEVEEALLGDCRTMRFTSPVADYSARRRIISIAQFVLFLAEEEPLSYLP